MTILITGANGTISSALPALLASSSDAKLRALVRDPAKTPDLPGRTPPQQARSTRKKGPR